MSRDILLNLIDPDPDQPRKHFDEASLKELAQSIEANGLAVPILLRPSGSRFTIVHGERRFRAVGLLGWPAIPAEVRDIDPTAAGWLALVENVQRNDLSPIEEAQAYQARLSEGLTQEQLGQRIGKTQSYIATKLRLLKLPKEVQSLLDSGQLTEGHAKQILRIGDYQDYQARVARTMVEQGRSVAEAKEDVDAVLHLIDCERRLEESLKNVSNDLAYMRSHLIAIKVVLTPEQYQQYCNSELDIGYALATRIEQLGDKPSRDEEIDIMFAVVERYQPKQ